MALLAACVVAGAAAGYAVSPHAAERAPVAGLPVASVPALSRVPPGQVVTIVFPAQRFVWLKKDGRWRKVPK